MTEPVKNITFGGVQFNENDIEKKEFDAKEEIYSVFLKNGVKISYPEQDQTRVTYYDTYYHRDETDRRMYHDNIARFKRKVIGSDYVAAKVSTHKDGFLVKTYHTELVDIKNAEIKGTDNVDDITLRGKSCNNKVDVTGDGTIIGDKVTFTAGTSDNEVNLDKSDKVEIKDQIIKGPGTAAQNSY